MRSIVVLAAVCLAASVTHGQEHVWGKFGTPRTRPVPPTLFLDQSERSVEFQLDRLDNERLLMTDRRDDDQTFSPIYREILSRSGMPAEALAEAVEALVRLENVNRVEVLLASIASLDQSDPDGALALAKMLTSSDNESLEAGRDKLTEAAMSDNASVRIAGLAGLATAGQSEKVLELAKRGPQRLALMRALPLIRGESNKRPFGQRVAEAVNQKDNQPLRIAAVDAVPATTISGEEKFNLVAPAVFGDSPLRSAAVDALASVPADERPKSSAMAVLSELVLMAERTKKKDRTSDEFLAAMQLADSLLPVAPEAEAREYRQRLRDVTVRLVRIATVEEEMRYDVPYFAVEAGRPVQIVLVNHDVMPHNLVVGRPGTLKQIAADGLATGPGGGWKGLPYVPETSDVLAATKMVNADAQDRITFDAPDVPGEYPYVCTFPQHWYRMYGVMVVVDDLDAFLRNPVPPANPIGSNRSFVADWKVEDLADEITEGIKGRSPEIGQRIFVEASCQGCHMVSQVGGKVGPALEEVYTRMKGDDVAVLREILEPSHRIEPKYTMHKVLTFDGNVLTGVLVDENDDFVFMLTSAEDKEPIKVAQDDIDAMVPSKVSIMPKALMNQYTKDEIFELMAYLKSIDPAAIP